MTWEELQDGFVDNAKWITAAGVIAGAIVVAWRYARALAQMPLTVQRNSQTLAKIADSITVVDAKTMASLNAHGVATVLCDDKGYNLEVSEFYAETLGVSESDLLGYGWATFMDHTERERKEPVWQELFQEDRKGSFECAMKRADGSKVRWKCYHVPMNVAHRQLVIMQPLTTQI